jgi:hypothetical protein
MSFRNLLAAGNISPARFVAVDITNNPAGSGGFKVVQANASTLAQPVGVSQEGTDFFPSSDTAHYAGSNYAAVAGEMCKVLGQGEEPLLELGGAVAPGDFLKPDTDGKGVAIDVAGGVTTPQFYGARALQAGASGEKIRVEVITGAYTYHA